MYCLFGGFMRFNKKIVVLAIASLSTVGSGAVWATAQDEVDKQVAKLLADAVARRVASTLVEAQGGATASEVNNAYGSYGRNNIGFTAAGTTTNSKTDIGVGGYDRALTKDWLLGAAVNGSRTSSSSSTGVAVAGFSSTGISPYVSYIVNNNFYITGKLGYTSGSTTGTTVKSNSAGVSFNGIGKWTNFVLKGRLELTGARSDSTTAGLTTRTNSSSNAVDVEAGYFFQPNLYGYLGTQFTSSNQPNSAASYARVGLEYNVNKVASIGTSYEGKVRDNQPSGTSFSSNTWSIYGRIAF